MKAFLATTCIVTGVMLAGGCATKKYVRNTAAPIQAKVDQVGEQTSRNGQQIEDTRNQVKAVDDKATTGINAATERANSADQHAAAADQHATTADQHAGEAMKSADQANQLGQKNSTELEGLRSTVANLDDYKLQTSVAVPFGFNKYSLSKDAQAELDKFADQTKGGKRFFIAVEGYTDASGSASYNQELSKRRADQVVNYLVAKHDIPIYRIHMIGLGKAKPVEEAKTRSASAKNRRVEVKVFSADQATTAATQSDANSANRVVADK